MIPRAPVYTIRRDDEPWLPAWAVQRALNEVEAGNLAEDYVFGTRTRRAVKRFQGWHGLAADGVFGPATSHAMAVHLQDGLEDLPELLLEGQIEGESGALIAATNWSVDGGVDCGYTQRRVLEADYEDEDVVERAFDAGYQIALLARTLRDRRDSYVDRGIGNERAWRLAVAYHNYPYGVDQVIRGNWPNAYSTTPAAWVERHGLRFPDGAPVRTPMNWLERYSLGNPEHDEPGEMVRYVTDWSP